MRVLFITHATCARARKQAAALCAAGIDVQLLQCRAADQTAYYTLPKQSFYIGKATLSLALARYHGDTFDVIHVHNEPDWMVHIARRVFPDKPIVYDCHDLSSMRQGEATEDEIKAMEAADAYIFPSKPYMEGAIAYHNLPDHKPKRVIYSCCLAEDIVKEVLPTVPAVVYEGGIVAKRDEFDTETATFPVHRDYEALAWEFRRCGIPLALYGVQAAFFENYLNAGAMVFGPISYNFLLPQLSRYSWGFVGSPVDCPQWHMAMPNKLFEYMAAGIPVIVYKADEAAAWVKARGVGVIIDEIAQINDVSQEDYDRYTQNVWDIRETVTMEAQVPDIVQIYRSLL